MDQDGMFYIVRIVFVSIVHGITLSILARGERHSRRVVAAAMAGLTLAIAIIGSVFVLIAPSGLEHVSWTAYMMLLVMGCVFCFVSSGSALTERLFVYIMYVAVFMLSVGYAGIISKAFFREDAELAQLVIRTAFSVVFIILLKVSLRDRLYRLVDGLSVHGMEITMFSWLTGLCVLAYAIFSFFFVDDMLMNAIVLALLTLMVISIFAIANTIVQLTSRELEMERATGRQRLLESELEAERVFVERAKAIRHDQRHHDRIILEYLNSGDISRAKEYLGSHDCSLASEALESWCQNPLLDAQLRIAKRYCLRNDIEFSVDVNLPGALDLNEIDFVSVIANLLENAIEAAVSSYKPYVSISLRRANNRMLLEIRNTFSSQQGARKNKESSGEGLPSVRMILERNEGLLQQVVDGNVFISRVILPVKD